jgi:hypothetical protein
VKPYGLVTLKEGVEDVLDSDVESLPEVEFVLVEDETEWVGGEG